MLNYTVIRLMVNRWGNIWSISLHSVIEVIESKILRYLQFTFSEEIFLLVTYNINNGNYTTTQELGILTTMSLKSEHKKLLNCFKGTVPQDFRLLFFFMNQFPPSP
jgi:hypothetical protein